MKINEVIIFEVDDETQAKRDAFADMDNKKKKKLKWNEIVANPDLTDLEFSVDGIDYKGYIDNKKNIFFVYDQALNDFVPADRNFTRRAFGKNISARIKNLLNLKPGGMEYIKNFFSFDNRGDPSLPGAGQAAKSTNLGGLIGSRIGGLIDRGLDKLRGKKQDKAFQQSTAGIWKTVYGVNPPVAGDTIRFKTADGKVVDGEFLQLTPGDLRVDNDKDGVPDILVKVFYDDPNTGKPRKSPTKHPVANTNIISVNGKPLKKIAAPPDRPNNQPGSGQTDLGDIGLKPQRGGGDLGNTGTLGGPARDLGAI